MNIVPLGFGKQGNLHARVRCNGYRFQINMFPDTGDVFVERVTIHSEVGVPDWRALDNLRNKITQQDYTLVSTYKEIFNKLKK